jgi:hypothetical protein
VMGGCSDVVEMPRCGVLAAMANDEYGGFINLVKSI